MAETKQFDQVDMDKLKAIQDKFNNIVIQLGQVNIELIQNEELKTKLEDVKFGLETDYKNLKKDEKLLAEELSLKYGVGVLNPETGVFTPREN